MKHFKVYVMNQSTILIQPEVKGNGEVFSVVMEGTSIFYVDMAPSEIVDYSIRYYGSTLEGNIAAAKKIVGNYHMVPIVICKSLDMYWFPTYAITNLKCAWMTSKHIEDFERLDYQHTNVELSNGLIITIDMNSTRLEVKINRVDKLRRKIMDRIERKRMLLYTPEKGFKVIGDSRKYKLKRK